MTDSATTLTADALNEYTDEKRLAIFKMISGACQHLYSKGKLQRGKFDDIAPIFADLAKNDPLFIAHLAAWASKQDSKDMKVLSVFFNALNDADGTPFFEGATMNKPNLRQVSYALLQRLDPHLALRVLELCHTRFSVKDLLNNAKHFPTGMRTAYRKYLKYREQNPDMLRGARKSGLGKKLQQMYRMTHTSPTSEAAAILGWKQKDGTEIQIEKLPDFANMTSAQIAERLGEERLSPMVALATIPPEKITAAVAKALLESCTGNQSIILYRWFSKNGFLDVKSINALFKDKITQSTTAIDRIDTLTADAAEEDKSEMAEVRSKKRKRDAALSDLGKLFLHIDCSSSMHNAIKFAMERASIIAECVDKPEENFGWGLFNERGKVLPLPEGFTKEAFYNALYGKRANGTTDCIALYPNAREMGAEVDIYVTDQGHNVGSIVPRLTRYHEEHPEWQKPKAAVIIDYSANRNALTINELERDLRRFGIPVSVVHPDSLTESALVAQSVRAAIAGELAVIDEIMDTPLPKLPKWYANV